MQLTTGSCTDRLHDIPLSIIEESASVNSRKGHTNTIRIRGAGAEDGIRDQPRSRGLGDVYKRQLVSSPSGWLLIDITRNSATDVRRA